MSVRQIYLRPKTLNKPFKVTVLVLALVVVAESAILLKDRFPILGGALVGAWQERSPKSLKEYADDIIQRCASESWKPGCYDKEIPKLMDFISMEDTFRVTKEVQQQDANYWYCHVLGHNVSAKETAKDPSQWKEVVARCPSGMCSNGCIHGAFQERFRTESLGDAQIEALLPDLKSICEPRGNWNPTGMEKATCYHALGHLVMYINNADIEKSIELCERAASPGHARVCFDGNFMQIFQPLEPEDFALVEKFALDTAEEAEAFCEGFSGQKFGACWRESWPLHMKYLQSPQGAVQFCKRFDGDPTEKTICYNSVFYILAAQFRFDADIIKDFCGGLPKDVMGTCFANSASRFIETDYNLVAAAVDLCATAAQWKAEGECYDKLVAESKFNFHQGSDDAKKLCESLPEPWRSKCTQ